MDLFKNGSGQNGTLEDGATSSNELSEERAHIALSEVNGLGQSRIRTLIGTFGSAQGVFQASGKALSRVDGIGEQTARSILDFDDWQTVDRQLQLAHRVGARLISIQDSDYPERLRHIYDPPSHLWCRGPADLNRPAIAIVGTRKCSNYGIQQAKEFASALSDEGLSIVSGLAYGIDAAAHRGALEAGGITLAILGSGVDRIYPARHQSLADSILEDGAILSEQPLKAAPDAGNFPERNRIISGMCLGVLVVEAHEKGGALITARLAAEHDREVFATPGRIGQRSAIGTNRLIQRGHAKLVITVEDVLEELSGLTATLESAKVASEAKTSTPISLSPPERQLLDEIGNETVHIDDLCRSTQMDVSTALVHLLSLEFKGVVHQSAGKHFQRVN